MAKEKEEQPKSQPHTTPPHTPGKDVAPKTETPVTPQTAPVTTDAAAHTPGTTPTRSVPGVTGTGDFPEGNEDFDDELPVGRTEKSKAYQGPRLPGKTRSEMEDLSGRTGAGESDISLKDLSAKYKAFIAAVKAGQWGQAYRIGMEIGLTFADLMDSPFSHSPRFQMAARAGAKDYDSIGRELDDCQNHLHTTLASSRKVAWRGDVSPSSGAESPLAASSAEGGGGTKAIDPQVILIVFELVKKGWEIFQQLRNR